MHFQVYSSCDGWEIQMLDGKDIKGNWTWGHQDYEMGVGGEKLFAEILKNLGCSVYEEEVY